MVYDCNGQYIQPVDAILSSSYSAACFPANLCIDSQATNVSGCHGAPVSMCHSAVGDDSPWLQVDLGTPQHVSSVFVLNRGDCCRQRIVGFQVRCCLSSRFMGGG